jgi:hypothetical protein
METQTASIALETAQNCETSAGERYGDMSPQTITAVANSILKALKANGLTTERRDELKYKHDCALTVMRARKEEAKDDQIA